jgi:ornithine cyclodeaminase
LEGEWLSEGSHVNAIGSNSIIRREIDLETARRAARIVVDDREQALLECGDLLEAWERGIVDPARMDELGDVVAGRMRGRTSDNEITLFESQGVGLWDLSLAEVAFQRAQEKGVGTEVEL